ncbi:MADF domain-containing protein, partial [Aphis craccivora]
MYSTEKLISEVQNYPCLWDMSSKEYSDKDLKKSCWRKVAEVVYSTNWNNFSSAEKEEKVNELRNKKWRHIRDAYNKYLSDEKNIRSGSEATKKKNHIHTMKSKTTGNCEAVEEGDATEHSVDDIVDVNDNNYEVSEVELNQSHKKKKSAN